MWNPSGIVTLYNEVLRKEVTGGLVWESQIQKGLVEIAHAYSRDNLVSSEKISIDFNSRSTRCAYVHRFSSLYTALAYETLSDALRSPQYERSILNTKPYFLQLCCLGGGPGTDLVGVWSALYHRFGKFHGSATVVDCMSGWEDTIGSVIAELQSANYPVSPAFDPPYFNWSFVTCDLLSDINQTANEAIASADLITMFKFLSAAACDETGNMLEKIFTLMKPGALVFFINNAGGGYHDLVNSVANRCQFMTVFDPWRHIVYENEALHIHRFGRDSLCKTTVTVQILRKPYI